MGIKYWHRRCEQGNEVVIFTTKTCEEQTMKAPEEEMQEGKCGKGRSNKTTTTQNTAQIKKYRLVALHDTDNMTCC